jgi:hypothetical protein
MIKTVFAIAGVACTMAAAPTLPEPKPTAPPKEWRVNFEDDKARDAVLLVCYQLPNRRLECREFVTFMESLPDPTPAKEL